MTKHFTQSILRFLLLIVITFSSGCGQSTTTDSPTLNPAPSQTPIAIVNPNPINTLEPIDPQGILIYSDYVSIYTINLKNEAAKLIFNFANPGLGNSFIIDKDIYVTKSADSDPHLSEITKINLNSTNAEQLVLMDKKYSPLQCSKLSPNKRYLLCYYGKSLRSILVFDTETKSIQTISAQDNHDFRSVSWSPDSKKIYLFDGMSVSSLNGIPRAGVYERGRLLEFSLETNKLSELLPELPNPNFRWSDQTLIVGWSPDGASLLINLTDKSGDLNENFERPYLYIFNVNSRDMKQIEVDGNVASFEWSPDGTKIALEMYIENQSSDLFIYTLDESLQKYDISTQIVYDFSWSPDSKKLILATKKDKQTYLYLFDDISSSIELITDIGYLQNPLNFSWSPNSDMVLYEQDEPSLSDKRYLFLFDTNKKRITDLYTTQRGIEWHGRTIGYWWAYHPTWSPDGKYFAFLTMSSNETDYEQNFVLNIQSVSVEGSMQIQIPRKSFIDNMIWNNNVE